MVTSKREKWELKKLALYRMSGYVIQLALILHTLIPIRSRIKELLPRHKEIQMDEDLGPRFATVWNVICQVIYIIYGLICDVALLLHLDSYIPVPIKNYRYTLFSGLIGPFAYGIALLFWPIYLYDRELILPARADILMSAWDNTVVHTLIVFFVLWEVAHLPLGTVKGSPACFRHIVAVYVMYVYVIIHTRFITLGVWPYKVLSVSEFNFVCYFILLAELLCCIAGYYIQFRFRDLVWSWRGRKHIYPN